MTSVTRGPAARLHLRPALLLALSTALSAVLVVAPAQAVPRVSVNVSVTSVEAGTAVRVTGRARGSAVGTRVVLQRREPGRWRVVDRARTRRHGAYALRVVAREGANRLRVVRKPGRGATRAASRPVRVVGVATQGTPPTVTPPPVTEVDRVRALVLAETNRYRAAEGLAPLAPMPALDQVAQSWTDRMAGSGRLEHNPTFAEEYPSGWRRAAENIAQGYTPEQVVAAWMGSPGHRANILGAHTHLGVGYVAGPDGTWFTQNFAQYPR